MLVIIFSSFLSWCIVEGEKFQFFLDVKDEMKPEWSYADFSVGSKIQCASLCLREKSQCSYFGFKEGNCYLMETLDEGQCIEDECSDPGMKIYKVSDPPITTTTTPTSISTTTTPTSISDETTTRKYTTTSELTTTDFFSTTITIGTTTGELTTTTGDPTTTTSLTTTTRDSDTTTTTEFDLPLETTTTEKPETTAQDQGTTTTATELDTDTTTTTASDPETTSTTTTQEVTTTTTAGPFVCPTPEPELNCVMDSFLINGLGSRSPFFGDVLSAKCYDFKEKMYDENGEKIHTFFSADGGLTVDAQCETDEEVIVRFKMCVVDAHIPYITIHCFPILDKSRIEDVFNASSKENKDVLVNCEDKTGLQKVFFMPGDLNPITRVIFQCFLFSVPDNEVAQVAGDTPAG